MELNLEPERDNSKRYKLVNHTSLNEKWINSILHTIGMYPLTMIRTLIQLGYEPLPPTFGKTIFGRPRIYLPNVLTYGSYIKDVDGPFGVYRGFYPGVGCGIAKVLSEYLVNHCYNRYVSSETSGGIQIYKSDEDDINNECYNDALSIKRQIFQLLDDEMIEELKICQKELFIALITTTLSHPLKVITTRTIAEFVGHENIYTNIFSSINEIWKFEGLSGFFSGLFSALLGCTCLMITSTMIYVGSLYLIKKNTPHNHMIKSFAKFGSRVFTAHAFYPFNTISTVMMVNGSRLRIAQPDNGYPFKNTFECFKFLKNNGRLYRGSSLFFRN